MDEEYAESVDTSVDMDVSDVDVADDISADILDDIPEDDYSEVDVSDDISEDMSDEAIDASSDYEEAGDTFEEDALGPEDEEMDEFIEDIDEDSYGDSDEVSEIDEGFDDIPEDVDETGAGLEDGTNDVGEILEDTENGSAIDQEESFGENIAEDVSDADATEGATDVEDADTTEQPEGAADAEAAEETTEAEEADASEQPEGVSDADATEGATDVEGVDTTEQPEAAEEATEAEEADASEQPEGVSDADATEGATDVEDADTTEQPEGAADAEAAEEATDVDDAELTDENYSDLQTYDYETSPETKDADNPETSGEFVSTDNQYRKRWEKFGEEFSDGEEGSEEWDELKDVPFSGDQQSETSDINQATDATDINSVSAYMNAHNYGTDDFATYSQDPQWRQLMRQEYPDYELPEMTQESASAQLSQYMNDHNYGADDYAEYSQDPIWRELHSTAFPDDELPPLEKDDIGGGDDATIIEDNKNSSDTDESILSRLFEKKDTSDTTSDIQGSHIKDIVGEDEYKKYQGFYDKLEHLSVSQDYKDTLTDRFRNMDVDVKDVYNDYSDKLKCLDTKHRGTAYFSPDEGGFRFDEASDVSKGLGSGNTFFHESAHMIDWLAGNGNANATEINNLTDMAQADYNDALSQIMSRDKCTLEQAQMKLSDELWKSPNESNCVSDIFGGLSGNKVSGAWGHSTNYWATRDRSIIGKEAFAEITADSACNANNIAFTKQYMPRTYRAYQGIIKSIKGGVRV